MADHPASQDAVVPGTLAQTTPVRTFDEMNTGLMVFELQGTVGELKNAVSVLDGRLDKTDDRLEAIERLTADIKDQLSKLTPKIDDIAGFIKHGVPNLATKADNAALKLEIDKRPTRRQTILDIAWVVGLIATVLAIGSKMAH